MKMKKIVATGSALALTAAVAVGGTLAYLQDASGDVVNTFTWDAANAIQLTLDEHQYLPESNTLDMDADPVQANDNYSIIPGATAPKDPTLHLDTETASYLYVVIDNELGEDVVAITGLDQKWNKVESATLPAGVEGTLYYYTGTVTNGDYPVFTGVEYADDLEYDEATSVTGTITVKGFAVQASAGGDAVAAWNATFGAPQG